MAKPSVKPPEGFVLDRPDAVDLPEGFVLDIPIGPVYQAEPNIFSNRTSPIEAEKTAKKVLDLAVKFEIPISIIESNFWTYEAEDVRDNNHLSAVSQELWEYSQAKTYPISGKGMAVESAKGIVRFLDTVAGFVGGTTYDWLGQIKSYGGFAVDQISKFGKKD